MRLKTGLLRSAWLSRLRGASWLPCQRGSDHGPVILHLFAFEVTRLDFTAARAPAFRPVKHGPLRTISGHPAVELHDAAILGPAQAHCAACTSRSLGYSCRSPGDAGLESQVIDRRSPYQLEMGLHPTIQAHNRSRCGRADGNGFVQHLHQITSPSIARLKVKVNEMHAAGGSDVAAVPINLQRAAVFPFECPAAQMAAGEDDAFRDARVIEGKGTLPSRLTRLTRTVFSTR